MHALFCCPFPGLFAVETRDGQPILMSRRDLRESLRTTLAQNRVVQLLPTSAAVVENGMANVHNRNYSERRFTCVPLLQGDKGCALVPLTSEMLTGVSIAVKTRFHSFAVTVVRERRVVLQWTTHQSFRDDNSILFYGAHSVTC
jgi:hypothetical protein